MQYKSYFISIFLMKLLNLLIINLKKKPIEIKTTLNVRGSLPKIIITAYNLIKMFLRLACTNAQKNRQNNQSHCFGY